MLNGKSQSLQTTSSRFSLPPAGKKHLTDIRIPFTAMEEAGQQTVSSSYDNKIFDGRSEQLFWSKIQSVCKSGVSTHEFRAVYIFILIRRRHFQQRHSYWAATTHLHTKYVGLHADPYAQPRILTLLPTSPDIISRITDTGAFKNSPHARPNHVIMNEVTTYLPSFK
jgi:hypothetical protein